MTKRGCALLTTAGAVAVVLAACEPGKGSGEVVLATVEPHNLATERDDSSRLVLHEVTRVRLNGSNGARAEVTRKGLILVPQFQQKRLVFYDASGREVGQTRGAHGLAGLVGFAEAGDTVVGLSFLREWKLIYVQLTPGGPRLLHEREIAHDLPGRPHFWDFGIIGGRPAVLIQQDTLLALYPLDVATGRLQAPVVRVSTDEFPEMTELSLGRSSVSYSAPFAASPAFGFAADYFLRSAPDGSYRIDMAGGDGRIHRAIEIPEAQRVVTPELRRELAGETARLVAENIADEDSAAAAEHRLAAAEAMLALHSPATIPAIERLLGSEDGHIVVQRYWSGSATAPTDSTIFDLIAPNGVRAGRFTLPRGETPRDISGTLLLTSHRLDSAPDEEVYELILYSLRRPR